MAKVRYQIRDNPAGNPVNGATVNVTTAGGSSLATPSTDANGLATYTRDGSPGPIVATATIGGRTMSRDGRAIDQLGTWYANDAPAIWRNLGNGVIAGYTDPATAANDMAVSPGTGLKVTVATGACLIDGHIYRCTSDTSMDIDANTSGSTRYDRVVVRFTREGQATEGACVLAVLTGTPNAGDAPALTRSSGVFEVSLAKVRVVDSASSLVSGDITDERYAPSIRQAYVMTNPNAFSNASGSYTAGDLFYVNNAGKPSLLAKGDNGKILTMTSGLPAWEDAPVPQTLSLANPMFDQAIAGYSSHSVGTSLVTIANKNTPTLETGKKYFVYARADMQGNAPSSGYITAYIRIEAGGTNTAGTTTGVASGERPIWAQDAKIVTGAGASINVAARAMTDTGTGSVSDASVHFFVIPLDIPAS